MPRRYDHVDLRVRSISEARPFYEVLLPALGFTRDVRIEGWLQFESDDADGVSEFFGVTESAQHVANECRIAFWVDSISEVDRLAKIASRAGARNVEGPVTTQFFSRIPVATILRYVIAPRTKEQKIGVGVDLGERCQRI
jgi:hypothetical protein